MDHAHGHTGLKTRSVISFSFAIETLELKMTRFDWTEMARESEVEIPAGRTQQHDPGKDSVTAFVSNLDYSLGEDRIRESLL